MADLTPQQAADFPDPHPEITKARLAAMQSLTDEGYGLPLVLVSEKGFLAQFYTPTLAGYYEGEGETPDAAIKEALSLDAKLIPSTAVLDTAAEGEVAI